MLRDTDDHSSLTAAIMSLSAEAALLKDRVQLLQRELQDVDTHIASVSSSLRQLSRSAPTSGSAEDASIHGESAQDG
jgi:prefoldin subunit 5